MSTQQPPSQSSFTPADDAAAPGHATSDRPDRGQRRGWNTATAIVGGLSALALLAAGSGAAVAAVMTQERNGSWDTASKVTAIDVNAPVATVYVVTSPTVDRPTVQWQETGWGLGEPTEPRVVDGTLQVNVPQPESWSRSVVQNISITVPRSSRELDLDLSTTAGAIQIDGDYKNIRASTDYGAINATGVKADVLDARAQNGQVILDGVTIRDRLDAHTTNGFSSVIAVGTPPKQASVTSDSGSYAVSFPHADYWYPEASAKDFDDPKLPRTIDPSSRSSYWSSDSGSNDGWGGEFDERRGTGSGVSSAAAKDVCKSKPADRPCLFLHGSPTDAATGPYSSPWTDDWDHPTAPSR